MPRGNVQVSITADTSGLQRGTRTAEKDLQTLSSKGTSHLKKIAGAAAAAGAAFAALGEARAAINTTEDLAKATITLHKNLGLSVKRASEWAAVARSRNIDAKQLNQSFGTLAKNVQNGTFAFDNLHAKSSALEKTMSSLGSSTKDHTQLLALQTRQAALLAKGAGPLADQFKRLGVSEKDLKSGNFNAVLSEVADGFGKLHAGTEKTALGMKLFGKGWQTVLPVLRDGSKAMNEQLALADKYGVTFKGKTVKSLKELIAAQRESKFATMGLQVAFGTLAAKPLTDAIKAFSQFILQVREGTGAGGQLRKVIDALADGARRITDFFHGSATATSALKVAVAAATAAWVAYKVAALAAALANPVTAIAALGTALVVLATHTETGRAAMRKLADVMLSVFTTIIDAEGATARLIGRLIPGKDRFDRFADSAQQAADKINALRKRLRETQDPMDGVGNGANGLGIKLNKLGEPVGNLGVKFGDLQLALATLGGHAKTAGNAIATKLTNRAADAVKKFKDLQFAIETLDFRKLTDTSGLKLKVPSGDGLGALTAPGKGSAALMGARSSLAPFASIGAGFGLHVSSGLRPGAITSSGNTSYHSSGEAIDEAGDPRGMIGFFNTMKARFGSSLAELIYTPGGQGIKNGQPFTYTGQVAADHFDHVHVALDTGKPGVGDGIGVAVDAARKAGFSGTDLVNMVAIAARESGYNPSVHNLNARTRDDSWGLWQINVRPDANPKYKNWKLTDPYVNAKAARELFNAGGLGPWHGLAGVTETMLKNARAAVVGSRGKGSASKTPHQQRVASQREADAAVSPYDQSIAAADVGIADAAASTSGPGQRWGSTNASRQAAAISAKRKIVGARIRKVRAALKGRLRPATRLRLTQELGSLLGEHAQLGQDRIAALAGSDTGSTDTGSGADADPGPTPSDYGNAALAVAQLTPDTADDLTALQGLQGIAQGDLAAAQASGDPRKVIDAANTLKGIRDSIESLTGTIAEANRVAQLRMDLDTQLRDNQLKIIALTKQGPEILASVIAAVSGGIGGKVGLGFQTPGFAGGGARY